MNKLIDTIHPSEEWNGNVYFHFRGNEYFRRKDVQGKPRRFYYLKLKCHYCGRFVFRERNNYRKSNRTGAERITACAGKCNSAGRSGQNNYNWGGGKKYKRGNIGGHVLIYAPQHPGAKRNFYPEHRLVMEEKIGRYLRANELVHHIDLDQENNALSNLVIFDNNREHFLAHGSLNKCVKKLLERGNIRYDESAMRYFVQD